MGERYLFRLGNSLSVSDDMDCDNESNTEFLSPSISREEIMEIIFDKPSNLKRLRSTVSEDSSSSQGNGQKQESRELSIKMNSKKSKLKKKHPMSRFTELSLICEG